MHGAAPKLRAMDDSVRGIRFDERGLAPCVVQDWRSGEVLTLAYVDADRIRELNRDHRGNDTPTDVLAFPVDGSADVAGPRELGDVVICPEHDEDLDEAAVHGVLHLCGYDHETDGGEMLALQAKVMASMRTADRGLRTAK